MHKRLRISGVAAFVGAMLVSTTLVTSLASASDSSDNIKGRYTEVTPDGLHRVDDPVIGIAWMKPGVDFTRYTKIWITPAGMTFKGRTSKHRDEYELNADQQVAFRKTMVKVFNEELGKSRRYTLTDAPGKDVLQVRGAILDVVSHSPPEPMGRGAVLTKQIGEATLVVELVDSRTGEILARGADRRIATSPWVRKSNKTNNLFELRSAARQWAGELRRRLDDL
jgi:hypothetical protein